MVIQTNGINYLEKKARDIRKLVLNMICNAKTGHPGGSLSCVDIITVIFFREMNHSSRDPLNENRDRFVLSKGHAAPALYAILAECGYFPSTELDSLRKIGSLLQGHPEITIPGVEVSTGSLGQGLSISCGIALAFKMDKRSCRVYTLLGDGECNEGQVWEAALFASHYNLDNLVAIIDRNKLQIDGPTEDVMGLEPLAGKWREFGWNVLEIDGNKVEEIVKSFQDAKKTKGQPTIIIAHTLKGKGVSFMEGVCGFHGRALSNDEMEDALRELGCD